MRSGGGGDGTGRLAQFHDRPDRGGAPAEALTPADVQLARDLVTPEAAPRYHRYSRRRSCSAIWLIRQQSSSRSPSLSSKPGRMPSPTRAVAPRGAHLVDRRRCSAATSRCT